MPTRSILLVATLALAGCGPRIDNPANPPQLGRWQVDSKLVALVANDVWVPREKSPFPMPPDRSEVKACIEPTLKSRSEIDRSLLANTDRFCHLDALEERNGTITSTGTCGPKETGGMTITGGLEFTGHERTETAEAKVSVNVVVRTPDGSSERVRAAYETRWKRLGDCS